MFILTHTPTSSAYCLLDDTMFQTPLYEDLTYDTCTDNWAPYEYKHADEVGQGIFSVLLRAQDLDPEYVPNDY